MALTVSAGEIILADHHNALVSVTAVKSGDTARTSTTSHSADPHLALSLPVGTFAVAGPLLIVSAADAAGDFSYRWAWTGTMEVTMGGSGPANTLASGGIIDGDWAKQNPDTSSPSSSLGYGVSSFGINVTVVASVAVTVAGVLTLEWAQLGSNANATTLQTGSRITAFRIA